MTERSPELSESELKAAEAVIRGQPPDSAAFGMLMGLSLDNAEGLLRPGEDMSALGLMTVMCLVGRLRGSAAYRDEVDDALMAYRLIEHLGASLPAADLTLDEICACQAELRGERSDIGALAGFLGGSISGARRFRAMLEVSYAFDPVLLACLVVRLHGRQVAPLGELLAVVYAVLERSHEQMQADFDRSRAH